MARALGDACGAGIELVAIERLFLDERSRVGPERHDFHELVYAARGTYRSRTGPRVLEVRERGIVVYPAGSRHRPDISSVREIVILQWQGPCPVARVEALADPTGRILSTLDWMLELAPDPGRQAGGLAPATGLLGALLHELGSSAKGPGGGEIARVLRYMRYWIAEDHTVGELARVACLSKFHFIRRFRSATGLTPMRMLRRMRVRAAEAFLRRTNLPMKAVAETVGLSSASHLARTFRRETGLRPSDVRSGDRLPRALGPGGPGVTAIP